MEDRGIMAEKDKRRIEFPAWYGEFGWEVASWAPRCRKAAAGYDQVVVTSFDGMAPLYADFATEFRCHGKTGRGLKYPKQYRPDGEFYRYGKKENCEYFFDVLIHGRGIGRKRSINYKRWDELLGELGKIPVTKACVGTNNDLRIDTFCDMRGLGLQELMDQIAAAKLVVGVSSGLMHLAAACGTDIVVWGDRRTYFGETLEKRYKVTWNPHNVRVGWLYADDFQPEPEAIAEQIEQLLSKSKGVCK